MLHLLWVHSLYPQADILDDFTQASLFFTFQAAEEAKKEAESRARGAEEELEQRRGELRALEETLRKAEQESDSRKARLDSFMKAMGSLQDDRDKVLNTYKQLEEKHLEVKRRSQIFRWTEALFHRPG